ncbi:putative biopolymer transport protein ExbB-like 2 [Campylobacterota bacterium]|nr:putative biopolymer transport protein ExbB-like 2 [Campylobacterota bacterium]
MAIDKDLVEWITFGVLIVLGFISLWVALERILFFRSFKAHDFQDRHLAEAALYKRLTIIASIAANAPYIGLLGTVFGIMITFIDIANSLSAMDAGTLMVGLALALKATAAGLFVAIPTSIAYNLLVAKAEEILSIYESAKNILENGKK